MFFTPGENKIFQNDIHSDRRDFVKCYKVLHLIDNCHNSTIIILCVTAGSEGLIGKGRWPHDAKIQLHVMPLDKCKPHNNPQ